MRIENPTNRNNQNNFQKKKQSKKQENAANDSSRENDDSIDLSSAIVILNMLIDAPEHQFNKVPFYFQNAAARDAHRAAIIAKSIQQKALMEDISLNYDMVLDLVISHANEKNTAPGIFAAADKQLFEFQHNPLNQEESKFFEQLYFKCQEQNVDPDLVTLIVTEYIKRIANTDAKITNTEDHKLHVIALIKKSENLNISLHQKTLLDVLSTFQ